MTAPLILVTEGRWTVPGCLTEADPYRYAFGWRWAQGPTALCIGINSSMGNEKKPDATMLGLRSVLAFNGFGTYLLGNPFARRARDPRALLLLPIADAIGPLNDANLAAMIERADVLVACWGVPPPAPPISKRVREVQAVLALSGKPLKCFGLTRAGFPRHPLYLPTRTPLEDYRP